MRSQGLSSDSPKDALRFNPEARQSSLEPVQSKRRATDRPKDYDGGMYLATAAFFAVVILILAGVWA